MAGTEQTLGTVEGMTLLPSLPPAAPAPAGTHEPPAEQRFLIRCIDWASYRKISEALNGRHFHMSFDGENLELMTTSSDHGQYSCLLGSFVVVLTEETGQPRKSTGDMTMDREDLEKGIEADQSFYLVNEPKVRHKKVDLSVDPPPDLGIEVDLTTNSRRRFGIYGRLGVPEIWRFDGQDVTIHHRQEDSTYRAGERSRYFPFLAATDLTRFVQQAKQSDENTLLRSFREWVRQQLKK